MISPEDKKMVTVQVEIPEKLYMVAGGLVKDGWFRDEKEIFSEAIRRFLASHQEQLMETFIRDDMKWALDGKD